MMEKFSKAVKKNKIMKSIGKWMELERKSLFIHQLMGILIVSNS